jgi:hypothetical protein
MKKMLLLMITMVVLAGPTFLGAYDLTAHNWKVLPEAIWAAATGGGTWATEVQITNASSSELTVYCRFYYAGGTNRGPFTLTTIPAYQTYRTTNILNTIDTLDTGVFDYYGRVGAVWFWTSTERIHVTGKTMHSGGYGKSLPGLYPDLGTSGAVNRPMMVPLMYNGTVNRSTTGWFNSSYDISMNVTFYIINANWTSACSFTRTIPAGETLAFNPFIAGGIDGNVYTNVWCYAVITAGPTSTDARGLMGFGSIVNNTTLDPTAAIAYPFVLANTAAAAEATALSGDPHK